MKNEFKKFEFMGQFPNEDKAKKFVFMVGYGSFHIRYIYENGNQPVWLWVKD